MPNRWGIPKHIEEIIKARDTNCVYCGVSFLNTIYTHKTRPTWEHIINDIRINGSDNIALCCASCNASKGSKLLTNWLKGKYCVSKGINANTVSHVVKKHLSEVNNYITLKER